MEKKKQIDLIFFKDRLKTGYLLSCLIIERKRKHRHLLGYKKKHRDFLGAPVAKTMSPQCRGPGFNPWSGN